MMECLTICLFPLAETIEQYGDAASAKCNGIKLPMTVAKMDGFSYYNFSVSYSFDTPFL